MRRRGLVVVVATALFACGVSYARQTPAGPRAATPDPETVPAPSPPARKSLMNAVMAALIHSAEQAALQQEQARPGGNRDAVSGTASTRTKAARSVEAETPQASVATREQLAVESEP